MTQPHGEELLLLEVEAGATVVVVELVVEVSDSGVVGDSVAIGASVVVATVVGSSVVVSPGTVVTCASRGPWVAAAVAAPIATIANTPTSSRIVIRARRIG